MPQRTPPPVALKEFLGATTRHTRRIEIYEQDGITRWEKDTAIRLKGGSVSVDYERDERRTLDLTLANDDGALINAPGEFWYDKIIKVYRGVRVNQRKRPPKILVLSDKTGQDTLAESFRQIMVGSGYGDVTVNLLASNYLSDIEPYEIIVGLGTTTDTQRDLLVQAYRNGKSVFVQDADSARFITAAYPTATAETITGTTVSPLPFSTHPVSKGWPSFTLLDAGTAVYSVPNSEWTSVSTGNTDTVTQRPRVGVFEDSATGGRAVALSATIVYQQYDVVGFPELMLSAFAWLNTISPISIWETQIGEFMIDRIKEPHFPHEVQITGRDYTKKCMNSKYAHATQFEAGYSLESLIGTIAGAAGISKRLLPSTGVTVAKNFFFERGDSRWEAMKEIATSYGHELFFDAQGYLVMREFRDPATTAPVVLIHTGSEGQIASYEKSTTDSRIANHVIVTGESSDSTIPNVYGEATNTDPTSPTNIDELGDRLYEYSSAFITTNTQAQDLADKWLAIRSLEEFELSFETLMLPWLEVGDILGWIDPRPAPDDPNTFLLSSLTLPLSLGPMSGLGRRVTIAG